MSPWLADLSRAISMEPGCQCRVYVDHLCLVCANCLEITVLTDTFPGIKFSRGDRPGVMLWRVYRRPNKVMPIMASSGSTSNSSFWKEASGARPGRVATGPTEISFIIDMSPYEWGSKFIITISRLSSRLSSLPLLGVGSSKPEKAANTFQAYQASVSDAWDIEVSLLSHKHAGLFN